MKVMRFFKPTMLNGLTMLGLLAAPVIHAQSPSGPITAAPTQTSPSRAAKSANPVAPPAPRTTILGVWKFNPDDSDDPRKMREDSRGRNGGNGGGRRGGGYGRRGGERNEERQKLEELFTPAKRITLSMTGAEVDLVDDRDRKRAFMTDGRKLQKSKADHYQEIAAKFDGTRLVSDEKDPRGNKMSRAFELRADGRQLVETLQMTVGRNNTPLLIRYVYDIPVETVAQSTQ